MNRVCIPDYEYKERIEKARAKAQAKNIRQSLGRACFQPITRS